jgi:hypothetical protein
MIIKTMIIKENIKQIKKAKINFDFESIIFWTKI